MDIATGLFALATFVAWSGMQFVYNVAGAELGRRFGANVKVVCIGIGPLLWEWAGANWVYQLKLIPLGSYTTFKLDEEGIVDDDPAPGDFKAMSRMAQAIVMLAGPVAILILGGVCLSLPVLAGAGQVTTDSGRPISPSGFGPLTVADTPSTSVGQRQLIEQPLFDLLTRLGTFRSLEDYGGFVAVGFTSARAGAVSPWAWVTLIGLVAVGCGLVNLLPLPALNGGHILFLGLEVALGRRTADAASVPWGYMGLLVALVLYIRLLVADVWWLISVL